MAYCHYVLQEIPGSMVKKMTHERCDFFSYTLKPLYITLAMLRGLCECNVIYFMLRSVYVAICDYLYVKLFCSEKDIPRILLAFNISTHCQLWRTVSQGKAKGQCDTQTDAWKYIHSDMSNFRPASLDSNSLNI